MFQYKHLLCAMSLSAVTAYAQQISLGTASNYAILAGSTITNTGLTVINARIGLSPGSSITGFLPGINAGEDIDNAAAVQAKADLQTAFTALAGLPLTTSLTGTDLGGQILTPGVYNFASSGGLTGVLTLDGQNNPNAVFVFQFGSTLTTASASSVVLINGANACNVYWQVGSSATLGTGTLFAGNVLAQASITVTTGTSLLGGGFFAITAAVTLDTNAIDPNGACGAAIIPLTTTATTATTAAPTTATTTITSTVTNSASTTTITLTQVSTITTTQIVATSYTTTTSTSTSTLTVPCSTTATATPTACSKNSKRAADLVGRGNHKTKTIMVTCAGHTSTHVQNGSLQTKTSHATWTSTSTVWHMKTATSTHTSTKTPACTTKAKRDYQRLFE
ncbi:hypothetical protein LTR86_000176 [Recurvomyces mirabilis]|nr:hypothetical protein LTR86_000176 [Recurvomyces mirabilis]